jgi:hypothetical protein
VQPSTPLGPDQVNVIIIIIRYNSRCESLDRSFKQDPLAERNHPDREPVVDKRPPDFADISTPVISEHEIEYRRADPDPFWQTKGSQR